MPTVRLTDRALLHVTGADAETFLQNILTIDLATIAPDELRPGALLTPQGKILFDFLVSRNAEGFRFDVPRGSADGFAKRLTLYRLRAKAEIAVAEPEVVVGFDGATLPDGALIDRRFPDADAWRVYDTDAPSSDDLSSWTSFRIAHGVAESGSDYELGDAFPHDVLLDQNGGVGFRKGCYVGQEVVSRMQHRGTARRRIVVAKADAAMPASGTPVSVNGRVIGSLGSVAEHSGLALVRIDKAKAAMDEGKPILAADVPLTLSLPAFVRFDWPQASSESAD